MDPATARSQNGASGAPQNGRENSALTEKINSLKQNAFTIIQEIRSLNNLSFADISRGIDLYEETCRFEIRLIQRALEETDGNQTRAARLLGLNLTTLNAKIKRYGIDPRGAVGDAVEFDFASEKNN
jgi:DNA-binding protein Fis